ncbi:Prefoldin [Peziza echinospora]|nr:Prefoldin [Peziza echinospora]
MADPARQLQDATADYQDIQKDLSAIIEARQRLDSQLQENQNVQKEFTTLPSTANIYKLIGPALIKQDKAEAEMNVKKRLEYITSEIVRIETQLRTLEDKSEAKKVEIIQLQTQLQALQQQQQQQAGAISV